MSNSSQMIPFIVETEEEYEGYYDPFEYTNHPENTDQYEYSNRSGYTRDYTPQIIILSVCILGLVGNGIVIWLLGFCIKRNAFTTYFLNLAVADIGVLIAAFGMTQLPIIFRGAHKYLYMFFNELFNVMYTAGQFLLMVISIDRCVLVFFPIWHRCHRPPHLYTIVCTIIWVTSLLLCEVPFILIHFLKFKYFELCFFVNALLCLPVLSISTLALFIKVYVKSHQPRWGKLLAAISLALLFFLVFAFPFNVLYILNYTNDFAYHELYLWGFLCTSINSSVNPAIYFLIGWKRRSRTRESLKGILQRVFNEKDLRTSAGSDNCT